MTEDSKLYQQNPSKWREKRRKEIRDHEEFLKTLDRPNTENHIVSRSGYIAVDNIDGSKVRY